MPRFSDPEPLGPEHELAGFECDQLSLDTWLASHARAAARAGTARTYVVCDDEQRGRVAGFHALTVASVTHADATDRATRGMPRHEIPVVLLARLAVDRSVHGRGVGAFLLQDALMRGVAGAEEFGIRAFLVHALDERAAAFYLHHGFEPSPTDPLHLMALLKDIRAAVRAAQRRR